MTFLSVFILCPRISFVDLFLKKHEDDDDGECAIYADDLQV